MKKENEIIKRILQAKMQKRSFNSIKDKKLQNNFSNKKVVKSKAIKRPTKIFPPKSSSSIFLTGGIGDIFAVESFLTNEQKKKINTIYYATNKKEYIEKLFCAPTLSEYYPNLKNHCVLWDDFSNFWCFYSIEDYVKKSNNKSNIVQNSIDLSILKVFDDIKSNRIRYNESVFLKAKLANIDYLNLPQDYLTILPYSTDKRLLARDFTKKDWQNVINNLQYKNLKGVVINSGQDNVPKNENIIDLSNKLDILEAVEVLKNSKGYLGIDSWLSVLAAKLFDDPNLQIKSLNNHCYDNAYCYYAPKKNFNFITKHIKYGQNNKKL
jgi:hypothetical protein